MRSLQRRSLLLLQSLSQEYEDGGILLVYLSSSYPQFITLIDYHRTFKVLALLPSPARHSSPHIMINHRLGSCFLALATFILHRSALRNNSDY